MVLSDNLMSLSQTFISPDIVKKFSQLLGEPEEKTKAGLKSAIPTLLMGIADKGATPEGAETIVNLARNHSTNPNSTVNDVSETNLSEGNSVLNGIFGNGLTPMISKLGNFTGLNTSSVAKMLGLAAPLVMGVIGNKVKKDNLNAAGLMGFFSQQKNALSSLLPSSLGGGAAAAAGIKGLGAYQQKAGSKRFWLFAGLAVLAVLLGMWFKSQSAADKIPRAAITPRSQNVSSMPEATRDTLTPTASTATNTDTINTTAAAPATKAPTNVAATGTTGATALSELSSFLKAGDAAAVPKRFSFKNLVFASSAATLMAGAESELDLIANAMKENAAATATIEGYTDNSGNAGANQLLSENRAKEVKDQLVSRGVAESRLTAVGKGAEGPIAPNETAEGRALNRRIEFVITKIK